MLTQPAIVVVSALLAVQSPAEQWFVLSSHDGGIFAVDRASVERRGEVVSYRAMVARYGGATQLGVPYAYQVGGWKVDCSAMTFDVDGVREHAADGSLIEIERPIVPNAPPDALPPGSPIHVAAEAVCRDKWGDQPPFASTAATWRATIGVR